MPQNPAPLALPLLVAALSSAALSPAVLPPAPARAQAKPAPSLTIGGSSTVFPIVEAAIAGFRRDPANRSVRIQLKETGTSAGMRQFCSGQLPIANASRPISSKELATCRSKGITFIELPIAFDALTVAVNRNNSWASLITTKELARLWGRQAEGRISRWNQINMDWPNRPIKLCGPGRDSGTYDFFNTVINGNASNARADVTMSEDDNVLVRCVASNPNAMGYFGYAYYAANRDQLKALSIVGPKGAVAPSVASVQKETYLPLSRPLFIYVNDQVLRSNDLVRRFMTYTMQNGLKLTEQTGYIPLPSSTYRLVESKLYRHVLGSSFGGSIPVGQSFRQTLRRSLESIKRPEFQ